MKIRLFSLDCKRESDIDGIASLIPLDPLRDPTGYKLYDSFWLSLLGTFGMY